VNIITSKGPKDIKFRRYFTKITSEFVLRGVKEDENGLVDGEETDLVFYDVDILHEEVCFQN
jgi:hypothetical protein